jgi:hypothetical protein
VMRFLNALGHSPRLAIYCDRKRLASGTVDANGLAVSDGYLRFVEMLARIETATGTPFPIPEDLSDDDIGELVVMDRLLAGETIPLSLNDAHVTIRAEAGELAAAELEPGAEGAWIVQTHAVSAMLNDPPIRIGHIATFARVRIGADATEAAAVLDRLRDTGRRAAAGENVADVPVPLRAVGPDAATKRLLTPEEVTEMERRVGSNDSAA